MSSSSSDNNINQSVIIKTEVGTPKGCDRLNPKKWDDVTAVKVAKWTAAFFGISVLAITICALVVQYPAASSTFFTTFGILGAASLVTLAIALVQKFHGTKVNLNLSIVEDHS
ncbi:MAG: hypothetical protein K940chlam9_00802 [Chlamydiae bacterium]|nr:hypothetical protein [Chlamydiota bacterium]